MIEVERLSKRYGSVKAVNGVSFAIGRGEIVGLLGLNGAGKTTTMRVLTTFLRPTSGRARLAGHDVLDEPLEVRRSVGYLPENVPLYPEMRVSEYLSFRARIKDIPRARRRETINRVVARCGLGQVEDRIVGHLSKGYRQRVGLAEAMLHAPAILILDEPTAGLDPVQIREVRALIRELGAGHTILLSTHIMSEVEAVCSRVIIIERGQIAVDDTLENLRSGAAIVLEARGPADAIRRSLESTPGVVRVGLVRGEKDKDKDGESSTFEIQTADGGDLREALAARVVQNGWALRKLDLRRTTLEDRFIQAVSRQAVASAADVDAAVASAPEPAAEAEAV
jgi:ABC-2 type transport system ATP-binding protein